MSGVFIAQRYVEGNNVYSGSWEDIPAAEHFADQEACAQNARNRIQAGEFGVVTKFRILKVVQVNTFRSK